MDRDAVTVVQPHLLAVLSKLADGGDEVLVPGRQDVAVHFGVREDALSDVDDRGRVGQILGSVGPAPERGAQDRGPARLERLVHQSVADGRRALGEAHGQVDVDERSCPELRRVSADGADDLVGEERATFDVLDVLVVDEDGQAAFAGFIPTVHFAPFLTISWISMTVFLKPIMKPSLSSAAVESCFFQACRMK